MSFDRKFFESLKYLPENFIDSIEKVYNDEVSLDSNDGLRFFASVLRDNNKDQERGFITLFDSDKDSDDGVIIKVPLITGSKEKDPAAYGGSTPPILFNMCEKIERRDHPAKNRHEQTMARIHPVFPEDMKQYSKRTFQTHGDYAYPFMTHAGGYYNGASTGCLAIVKAWDTYKEYMNKAWDMNGGCLPILVEDI